MCPPQCYITHRIFIKLDTIIITFEESTEYSETPTVSNIALISISCALYFYTVATYDVI